MKKRKTILFILIELIILSIAIILSVIFTNKITIKKIDSKRLDQLSTNGQDFVGTVEHLKGMQEAQTELTNFKSKIATAITKKGVSTDATATAETMANNIASISKTRIIKLGQGTSFNVSSYEGYQNFTTANFLIESSCGNVQSTMLSGYTWGIQSYYYGLRFGKSYNNNTGTLSITINAPKLTTMINMGNDGPADAGWKDYSPSYSYNVYLVY